MVTEISKRQASIVQAVPELFRALFTAFTVADIRNRILFTVGILIAFRFMAQVTIPGANLAALQSGFGDTGIFGILNIFSGGALENLSIASLGVYPYITASIVMQILTPIIPKLREMSREGESGRTKINRYTHYLMVPLAFVYAYAQLNLITTTFGAGVLAEFGLGGNEILNTLAVLFTMTATTMLLVWMGELITEKGIGNGISLIIFVGIVATIPGTLGQFWLLRDQFFQLAILIGIMLVISYFIVYVTEGQRRIPVQYGKNVFRSGRMYRQTGASFIPLRVNAGGYDSADLCVCHHLTSERNRELFRESQFKQLLLASRVLGR